MKGFKVKYIIGGDIKFAELKMGMKLEKIQKEKKGGDINLTEHLKWE